MKQTRRISIHSPSLSNALEATHFEKAGRWLLSLPGPRALQSFVRRAFAIAEPPRYVEHRAMPRGRSSRPKVTVKRYPSENEGVTVLSANLWHDWPRFRFQEKRLEAFAGIVEQEGADILLLQEVARTRDLRVDDWLAERLGMAYVYARANGREEAHGFEEGLAIFSRFALARPNVAQLYAQGFPMIMRRLALGATAKTPWGDLLAVSTHLGHGRKKNKRQFVQLQQWINAQVGDGLALIGGDFNIQENSVQVREAQHRWTDVYRQLHPTADATTYRLLWPWGSTMFRWRLDYLFLQPGHLHWDVVDARSLDSPDLPHSDHRAVVAHLVPRRPLIQ